MKDHYLSSLLKNPKEFMINISPDLTEDYTKLLDVFKKIDESIKNRKSITIAIEGNSGAGKSSLAGYISSIYDSNLIHMDNFFLRPEQKTEDRLNEVGGNIDYERFNREVIKGLKSNLEFEYQTYDCKTLKLDDVHRVKPKMLNIIEGVYSMHPLFIDIYDLKIFLEIDEKTQVERILKRNGELMLSRFINEWIPMENKYFREMNIRDKSDTILRLP